MAGDDFNHRSARCRNVPPVDEVEVPWPTAGENRQIGGCLQGHATALRFSSPKQRLKDGWRQPGQGRLRVARGRLVDR